MIIVFYFLFLKLELQNIMGSVHKVSHEDQTPSELMKKKDQIDFMQNDYIRQFEGDVESQYQLLSPALVSNDFYELRKIIYKKTKLCKAAFIINKYKVRTQQRQLLEEQIDKLKKIDNPYLLKIYELYHDKHRFYIICQFCKGQSLASILVEQGSVPERKAAQICHQMLNVLAECHRHNIIHSDLKLQNLTFNSNSEEVIKITDFSISRIFRIEDIIEQSRKKAFLAAPQTLDGQPTSKSDVWSVGIILYIILSGQIPIYGSSLKRIRQKMLYYEPSFDHQKFKFISKQAKNLIKMMLTFKVQSRPTAEQCLAHPWFKRFYQPIKIPNSIYSNILTEGFNYNPSSKLQQATWGLYVNAFISFDEKQSILHVFSDMDRGCKGMLTEQDLIYGFRKFHPEHIAQFLANFTYKRHKCKPIKFSEFVAICTNRQFLINDENNKNLFNIFDDDESGEISVSELKSVLGASKEIPQEIWLQLMKEADENSDGLISYEQFTNMMREMKNISNQGLLKLISSRNLPEVEQSDQA